MKARTIMGVAGGLAGTAIVAAAGLGLQAARASQNARARIITPQFDQVARAGIVGIERPIRIALLGDSTVAGVGVRSLDAWLGSQLATRVAHASGRPVEVVGFGVVGARSADVLADQVPRLGTSQGPWDAVVMVVGGNDVTHLTPYGSIARDTADAVRGARLVSGGAPVIFGGVPRFFDAAGIARPLRDVYDRSSRHVAHVQRDAIEAAGTDATFVDIGVESSLRHSGRPESVSPDGFHPSEIGYGFWADALAPATARAVSPGRP